MSNIDYKKRAIILSFVCALIIIALAMTFISLIQSLKEDNSEPIQKHLYATVLESGNNYIRVNELDSNNSYMFKTKEAYNKGDLVSISYIDDNNDLTTKEIEVIASKEELDALDVIDEPTTTAPDKSTTTYPSTTTKETTTKKSTSITTRKTISSDNEVVNYVKNEYDTYSSYSNETSIPEKAKNGFITIIDFIFYNGTIKGKHFSDLTDSAKAKIIYYALLIDDKIDTRWPDYKNTIKSKASDIKAKLIAKYMDVTTSLCDNHKDACEVAKTDFNILKKSLNITWNVIKDAAKYGYGKVTTYLKNWYETWRDNA